MFVNLIAITAGEVFKYIGFVLVALVALMVMIVIHELGHYLAGKLLGFKIDEFGIGFGPPIFKRVNKKTGEVFTLRPFPVGGFCAFHGEDEDKDDPQAFNNQKPWKRLIVLFSGAFFNLISAILIITIYFTTYGQHLPEITNTYELSSYENLFEVGDYILAVNGKQVNLVMPGDARTLFSELGDTAEFKVLRDGKAVKFTAHKDSYYYDGELAKGESPEKIGFGVSYDEYYGRAKLPFFRAFARSFGFCFVVVFEILAALGQLIMGKGLADAGGTITVIKTIAEMSSMGFDAFLYVVAIISANLAVMNLLPLPALDGSRMVFTGIEMVFRKPVPRKVEAIIHTVGLIVLILLAVFLDIFHLVKT